MEHKRKAKHQEVGDHGERIACRYLQEKGYRICDTNASNRYGEIDIIALRKGMYHFVEVKTLSGKYYPHKAEHYHPLDHLNKQKKRALNNAIWEYRREYGLLDTDCTFSAIALWLDESTKQADIKYYPHLEIGD
ncbi:MAG: YraN family protein [Patescibacteria group bacterium]